MGETTELSLSDEGFKGDPRTRTVARRRAALVSVYSPHPLRRAAANTRLPDGSQSMPS